MALDREAGRGSASHSALTVTSDVGAERRGLYLRRGFLATLAVFVGLGAIGVFGVRSTTVEAGSASPTRLLVEYPRVTRAGLPAAITIRVDRRETFTAPIVIAIDADYWSLFDEQGTRPQPDASTSEGPMLVWKFEPPDEGSSFVINIDAIVETGQHFGQGGTVELRDRAGRVLRRVELNTRIAP